MSAALESIDTAASPEPEPAPNELEAVAALMLSQFHRAVDVARALGRAPPELQDLAVDTLTRAALGWSVTGPQWDFAAADFGRAMSSSRNASSSLGAARRS